MRREGFDSLILHQAATCSGQPNPFERIGTVHKTSRIVAEGESFGFMLAPQGCLEWRASTIRWC